MQIEIFVLKPPVLKAIRYDITNGPEIVAWSGGKVKECETLEPTDRNPSGAFLETMSGAFAGDRCHPGQWIGTLTNEHFWAIDDSQINAEYVKIA